MGEISEPYAKELARQVDELEAENERLRLEVERLSEIIRINAPVLPK